MGAATESLANYCKSQSNLTQTFIPRRRLNSLQRISSNCSGLQKGDLEKGLVQGGAGY